MKTRLLSLLVLAFCANSMMLCAATTASLPELTVEDETEDNVSLNDIRFANFSDEDWLDNDYIRALRMYLDDAVTGEIEDEELTPYLDIIKEKFVILNIEPAIMGGTFMYIAFIDHPQDMFVAWVYSDVDTETKTIGPYHTNMVSHHEEPLDLTKEQIMQIVEEHPELKLW